MASKWTKDEIDILIELYPHKQNRDIAKELSRSVCGVASKAHQLELEKSEAFYNDPILSGRNLQNCGKDTRFKKGLIPHNKNRKLDEWMSKESIEKFKKKQFKKGSTPHNALPVGSEVLRFCKKAGRYYFMIKVEGINSLVYKHVYIFEKYHNLKLKRGENVIFKDGNTANFSIDNLECISNVELMKRNSIQRYPDELKAQIFKNARLKKIIKKLEDGKN